MVRNRYRLRPGDEADGPWYDMAGRRVKKDNIGRGLHIRQGKKVFLTGN